MVSFNYRTGNCKLQKYSSVMLDGFECPTLCVIMGALGYWGWQEIVKLEVVGSG